MTLHSASAVARDGAPVKALTAARDGFSLNAAVACEAHQREKLERVCRYVARGPIALDRLSVDGDGLVVYQLKHPFRDGTTHVLFEPLDFIARLAALVPRPRAHLVRYHGLFAPHARHRQHIVARHTPTAPPDPHEATPTAPIKAMSWMQRLRRVFALDTSTCARCLSVHRLCAPRPVAGHARHCAGDVSPCRLTANVGMLPVWLSAPGDSSHASRCRAPKTAEHPSTRGDPIPAPIACLLI
jgi:hypothetical protein